MSRPVKTLPPGDVVGLIAALVETPILADCVPLRALAGSPAGEELLVVLRDEWQPELGTDATPAGFADALDAHLTTTQRWQTRETVRRALAAVDAWPALIDRGRALLTRYGQQAGYLATPAPAPAVEDPFTAWLERGKVAA